MPDSLIFDGTDDKLNIGSFITGFNADMTILFIVKFVNYTNFPQILSWNSVDGGLMIDASPAIQAGDLATGGDLSPFTLSGTSWQLIGYGKAAGTVIPRYHRYIWDTAAWSHSNGGNFINNFAALTSARIGDSVTLPGQNFQGNMLIGGIWNANLSDLFVETLITGKTAWENAIEAWRFDSMSPLTSMGLGQSAETSRTGTAVATGIAPAGWTDTAGTPPQQIRPDADVATTGWTTTPLFSKVDEATTDDADFITSTAS